MEKQITVNSKTFNVKELLGTELDEILEETDKKKVLMKEVMASTGITAEEYGKLTVKERLSIVQTINELNGIGDFQKSSA